MIDWQKVKKDALCTRKQYPSGTRILLLEMKDPFDPVPPKTRGTVYYVDDLGQLQMHWDNGRSLALVPGIDRFRKLTAKELSQETATKAGGCAP